jgi:hypothetical protein
MSKSSFSPEGMIEMESQLFPTRQYRFFFSSSEKRPYSILVMIRSINNRLKGNNDSYTIIAD